MKHRISFAAAYACVLSLFVLGAALLCLAPRGERISQRENRTLQGFPAFSAEKVISGDFMEEFEAWLSDGFFARDRVVAASEGLLGLWGRHDRAAEVQEAMTAQTSAAPGEALPAEPAAAAEATAAPGEPETVETGEAAAAAGDGSAAIWLVAADGSVHVEEEYPAKNLEHIAAVLEEYRACLPEDGRILFVNTPVSFLGNKITDTGEFVDWGCSVDEALQPLVDERITVFDPMDILRPYLGVENLFSSYDHHWHIEAAWHEAHDMVAAAGYPPIDFWEFMYRLQKEFYEAPYTPEQLKGMTLERENRLIPEKTSPLESYLIKHMTRLEKSVYMEDDRFGGYGIYLGGRRPPWRLFRTGYHTGRNALIIGDSFYHAFLPFLTPYYDTILSTDPRDDMYHREVVGGSIRQYMELYDISDIYFVMCNYDSLNDAVYQDRLERYLNTDYGAIYTWK